MSRITKRDLILSLEDAGRTPAEIARALETTEAYVRAVQDAEQTRTIPPDPAIFSDLLAALKAVMPYATMMEVSMTAEAISDEGGEPADNYLSAIADARAAISRAEGER